MRDEPQGVSRGFRDTGRQPSGPQGPGGKVCVQIEKTGAVPYGGVPLSVVRSGNMKAKQAQAQHRAIGYCRVSTADQADFGVSLDAQTEKIRVWSVANGYELADVLVDRGLSGGRCDNRPALQEALKAVSRGDSLVVYSLSRLARSTRDTLMIAEALERKGADLVSLSERIDTTSSRKSASMTRLVACRPEPGPITTWVGSRPWANPRAASRPIAALPWPGSPRSPATPGASCAPRLTGWGARLGSGVTMARCPRPWSTTRP